MAVKQRKTRAVVEFGDFQTPPALALAATQALVRLGIQPRSILEPTCGRGAFVHAAATSFPEAEAIIGIDVNQDHLDSAARSTTDGGLERRIEVRQGDFFTLDWRGVVTPAGDPWLILGNPPWVTNSELGAIRSDNLPQKSNVQGRRGIEAITGKSNFDISEWMLLRYLDWLEAAGGTIAVLCKTSVARKVLLRAWKGRYPLRTARMYGIDALRHFGAAVDACFFVLEVQPGAYAPGCDVYATLDAAMPGRTIGFDGGHLIADMAAFSRQCHLFGPEEHYAWRSGIKHDCSKVMELASVAGGYRNGLGEAVALEDTVLFPLLKSSDIGNGRLVPRGVMLVPQRSVGQETSSIARTAPKTWDYLRRHADLLGRRGSVIYRNKPAFSVFGVGPYSFAPWKVAISGFYKHLRFVKVGPVDGRPVVFDDTVNFLPCQSEEEADFLGTLLNSEAADQFFRSMIHWEDKRPITVDVLGRLGIGKLAAALGRGEEYGRYTDPCAALHAREGGEQRRLFE